VLGRTPRHHAAPTLQRSELPPSTLIFIVSPLGPCQVHIGRSALFATVFGGSSSSSNVSWTDYMEPMGSKPFSSCAHLFMDDQMDHITVITLALSSFDHHDSHNISATQVSGCNLGNLIFSISLGAVQKRLAWGQSANACSKDSEVDNV
jgi:hypothetical protein